MSTRRHKTDLLCLVSAGHGDGPSTSIALNDKFMNAELFIYRYFKLGTSPFRNLSELGNDEIVHFMRANFPGHEFFHSNPEKVIKKRRAIEKWLWDEFVLSGGEPHTHHPCYFTLGKSDFLKKSGSYDTEIEIPLSLFSSKNISFTFPDSFFPNGLVETRIMNYSFLN